MEFREMVDAYGKWAVLATFAYNVRRHAVLSHLRWRPLNRFEANWFSTLEHNNVPDGLVRHVARHARLRQPYE